MRFNHGRMDRSCPPPLLWQLVSHSWDCYRCNPWLRLTSLADIPSPSHQIKKAPKTKRNQVTRSSNCLASQPKDSWTARVYNGLICYNDIIWYRFVMFCDALCSHVAICAHIQCFYILVHTCGLTTSHRRSWRLGAHLLSQCGVLKHKRGHIIFCVITASQPAIPSKGCPNDLTSSWHEVAQILASTHRSKSSKVLRTGPQAFAISVQGFPFKATAPGTYKIKGYQRVSRCHIGLQKIWLPYILQKCKDCWTPSCRCKHDLSKATKTV